MKKKSKTQLLKEVAKLNSAITNEELNNIALRETNNNLKERNESLEIQNSVLEKRLLATEVELLRKIVALYEQRPKDTVTYYPSSNGVANTSGSTITTTSTIV
jgi:CRISPR/Cas system-associated endoribonuclease Cas2|tara:strand:+ start:785 stop:1093 length:309 start_codon:yes stop_codon:yes gene_type:complete